MIYRTRENPCNLADQRKEEQLWILEGSATWVLPMSPVHCVTHVSGPDHTEVSGPARIRTWDQRIVTESGISDQAMNFLNENQGEPVKATRWPQGRNKGVLPRCCRGGGGPLRVSVDLTGDRQADNLPSLW